MHQTISNQKKSRMDDVVNTVLMFVFFYGNNLLGNFFSIPRLWETATLPEWKKRDVLKANFKPSFLVYLLCSCSSFSASSVVVAEHLAS